MRWRMATRRAGASRPHAGCFDSSAPAGADQRAVPTAGAGSARRAHPAGGPGPTHGPELRRTLFGAAALLVAGCASIPTGPSVMVLPGSTKTWDQFQVDEADCRTYSSSVIGNKAGEDTAGRSSQQRYDSAYQQCMYAKGHQVPMARGAVPRSRGVPTSSSSAPPPPPPPAGAPPPPPSGYRVN
jgi:hypothetical protein